jgi:Rrf2 family protein
MLKMSKRVDYGLQLLAALQQSDKNNVLSLRAFSEENSISFLFLQKIVQSLKKANMVGSVQGAGGGYYLTRDIEHLTLKEVMEAIEGPYALVLCQKKIGACKKEHNCTVRPTLSKMRDDLSEYFGQIRVKDFIQ